MAFVLGEVIVLYKSPIWILFTLLILCIIIIKKFDVKLLVVILISVAAGIFITEMQLIKIKVPEEIINSSEINYKGTVENRQLKKNRYYYYLDNVIVVSEEDLKLKIGNHAEFKGKYLPFMEKTNPGCFDEKRYYNSLGIIYKISADSVIVNDDTVNIIKEKLYQIKMSLKEIIYKIAPEKEASLLSGIILGESSEIDEDIKNLYRSSGIAHIIAVSGLHISLIGLGVYRLLRRRFYFVFSALLSASLTYGFIIMTGEAASGLRALYMFLIFLVADIIGRTYDSITSISVAALLILIQNPLLINNTGFLLSFLAVISIVLVVPVCKEMVGNENKITQSFFMSLAAIIGTMPILADTFYEISTYSLLINLIILPFVGIVMVSGLLASIFGTFSLFIGTAVISTGLFFLKINEAVCRIFSCLPYYSVVVGEMGNIKTTTYYLLICLTLISVKKLKRKTTIIACILCSCLLFSLTYIKFQGELEITVIDVGQGDGILIRCPDNDAYMIDGGSSSETQVGKYTLIPIIKSKGIGVIDYWFVTHGDADHNSGLIEILQNYTGYNIKIKNLVLPETVEPYTEEEEVLNLAVECGINILKFQTGSKIQNGEINIKCLHPSYKYKGEDINGHSLILSLEYKKFDVLFTGDIETDGEEFLMESGTLKDYDVLKVAHHGSKNSTSEDFLNSVSVEFALISCSENNVYGHPNYELLKRLDEAGAKTLVTKDCGAIEIKSDGEKYTVSGYTDENGEK